MNKIIDQCIEIIQKTNDGNDLSPHHLFLVQKIVNGGVYEVSEEDEVEFAKLITHVREGYTKPSFHGIEHLTIDHDGYVYWKGVEIEHYSFRNCEEEKKEAIKLGRVCRLLESIGTKVDGSTIFAGYDMIRGNMDNNKIDECATTIHFWDCDCTGEGCEKFEYIKPKTLKQCPKCKCTQEEQPDSRFIEVIAMMEWAGKRETIELRTGKKLPPDYSAYIVGEEL